MSTELIETYQPDERSVGIVETQFASLFEPPEKLRTEKGEELGPITVAYESYGKLTSERDNAIFVCHALTGDAHAAGYHSSESEKPGTQPMVILNNLYKLTPMQSSFSANMLALVEGSPVVITLKNALQQFIDFRQVVVTRRSEYELRRAQERAHILAGLRIAISNLDDVIALIRRRPQSPARSGAPGPAQPP